MVTPESNKTEIEVLKANLGNIKESLHSIDAKLDIVLKNYVRREDFESSIKRVHKEMDLRIGAIYPRLDSKLDTKVYEDYRDNLKEKSQPFNNIFWNIITELIKLAILGGLLAYFLNK